MHTHTAKAHFIKCLKLFFLCLPALITAGCASSGGQKTLTYNFTPGPEAALRADAFSRPGALFSGTAAFEGGKKVRRLQFMALRRGADIRLKFYTGLSGAVMDTLLCGNRFAAAFSGDPKLYAGDIGATRIRLPEAQEGLPVALLRYAFQPKLDMKDARREKSGRNTISSIAAPDGIMRRIKTDSTGRVLEQSFSGATMPFSVIYASWNDRAAVPYPREISIADSRGRTLVRLKVRVCKEKDSFGPHSFDLDSFGPATGAMREEKEK